MKSKTKVLNTIENVRQGYGIWIRLSKKDVWDAMLVMIPKNANYLNHIYEDIFIPYTPERIEVAKSPTLNQNIRYVLGKMERTLTVYYEDR